MISHFLYLFFSAAWAALFFQGNIFCFAVSCTYFRVAHSQTKGLK